MRVRLDELLTEAVQIAAAVDGVTPKEWVLEAIWGALGKRECDLELDRLNTPGGGACERAGTPVECPQEAEGEMARG